MNDEVNRLAKKKKRLPRGLEDLMEQNEDDLPFLDVYGPAEESDDGADSVLDDSTPDAPPPIFEALLAHLRIGASADETLQTDSGSFTYADRLTGQAEADGSVSLSFTAATPLPLVSSDLAVDGLTGGELATDRLSASCTVEVWSDASRRLLDRLFEHWRADP